MGGSVFMLRGKGGKWQASVSSCVPRKASPRTLPLRDRLHKEQKVSPLCVPGVFQIPVSILSAPSCLSAFSLQEQCSVCSGLYPSQAWWLFFFFLKPIYLKTPVLSPAGFKNSWKSAPVFGGIFSYAFPCMLLSLKPFSATTAPSFPQQPPSTSPLNHLYTFCLLQ